MQLISPIRGTGTNLTTSNTTIKVVEGVLVTD